MTSAPQAILALGALFEREAYARVEPPVLQPAEAFVELSGEDIRRRMFVTQDALGRELCLRPEFTIPVCLHHLAVGSSEPASYWYGGPVFRLRAGETGEFPQAGVESIGRPDRGAADAEILGLALEGLEALGLGEAQVRLGDVGLLDALLGALLLAPAARRRIMRAVVSGRGLAGLDEGAGAEQAGLVAALEGQSPQDAQALVEDVLAIAGITRVGGRSAAEIAERYLARAARRSGLLGPETRGVLDRYLSIQGDPDAVGEAVRALAREAGLDLGPVLDAFEERTGFMAARGLDLARFRFAADFARNLDYYTGFIFEVRDPAAPDARPVVGGGRYDRLLRHLGAAGDVPAVGCSFWLDRIPSRTPARGGA